jgi:high affinity Mn2+ porin
MRRLAAIAVAVALAVTGPAPARAGVSEPAARADDEFDFMNLLTRRHLHDLDNEQWNVYGQLTWISSFKLPFQAPYTNTNTVGNVPYSLLPTFEHSFTGTFTAYVGARLWRGADAYFVPEIITLRPLSELHGLGGAIQNFELQKTGSAVPSVYISRLYFRQSFSLGGALLQRSSDPMQLGGKTHARRLVLILGNFSALDFFDKNSYAGDLRRQFFNMAFLTYSAFDFAADARGYTWGGVLEFYWDDWAARIAHTAAPVNPNQLELSFEMWNFFGEEYEVEHNHLLWGRPGVVRLLGYFNRENMGRFDDAIAAFNADPTQHNAAQCQGAGLFNYGSTNAAAPDLCWARQPNYRGGVGLNLEQSLPGDVGFFFRGMWSTGKTEVYSYTSTDYSLSLGLLAHGTWWRRRDDYAGVGVGVGWISTSHARYLALGGVDGFVGDGAINQAAETVFETFYGVNLSSSIWLSGDYQFIASPAYNKDRGPVHVLGVRAHAEF